MPTSVLNSIVCACLTIIKIFFLKENVYAIASFDDFSRELKLEIIEASSEIEALKKAECYKNEQVDWDSIENVQHFKDEYLGDDFWLEIKQVID